MKKLIMAFWVMTMLALAACGGTASPTTAPTADSGGTTGGGGDTSSGPAAAVQTYFEALTSGDTATVNSSYCAAANVPTPSVSAVIPGATFDFSGLTYTVSNETADTATVTVGGSYTLTTSGVDTPVSMPNVPFNVTNENGSWKICG